MSSENRESYLTPLTCWCGRGCVGPKCIKVGTSDIENAKGDLQLALKFAGTTYWQTIFDGPNPDLELCFANALSSIRVRAGSSDGWAGFIQFSAAFGGAGSYAAGECPDCANSETNTLDISAAINMDDVKEITEAGTLVYIWPKEGKVDKVRFWCLSSRCLVWVEKMEK